MYVRLGKRAVDLVVSISGLLLLWPLLLVVALLLWVANRQNPLFRQVRPGRQGNLFTLIKFKTMDDRCDVHGQLLPDAERLTSLGKFLRKSSLDELPQLWNVLRGDMSLIGPRPLLKEYLPLYTETQKKRHDVRPGITGWAQVNGRNSLSWSDKFAYDVWYVEHVSLTLDIKILYMTLVKILRSEGINSATAATMEKFKGSQGSQKPQSALRDK